MVGTDNLRFGLLGPVRAWRDTTELALGSPQQRTILALLLLRGGALATADELVDALWSGAPPRAAVNTVRTYVSRLRRLLGATVICSTGGGYVLRTPAESVDAFRFRAHTARAHHATARGEYTTAARELSAALALDRGRPLAGTTGPVAAMQRARLEHMVATAREDLLAVEVGHGRHTHALPDLVSLVAEHPLRERPRELLITALYLAGRPAEAMAQYHETRRLLADELGIDPGAVLQRLHRDILTGALTR